MGERAGAVCNHCFRPACRRSGYECGQQRPYGVRRECTYYHRRGSSSARNTNWYPDHVVYNATKDQLKAMPEFKY